MLSVGTRNQTQFLCNSESFEMPSHLASAPDLLTTVLTKVFLRSFFPKPTCMWMHVCTFVCCLLKYFFVHINAEALKRPQCYSQNHHSHPLRQSLPWPASHQQAPQICVSPPPQHMYLQQFYMGSGDQSRVFLLTRQVISLLGHLHSTLLGILRFS